MTKRKFYLTVPTLLILFFILVGCSPREMSKTSAPTNHALTSGDFNPEEVEWVKRVGGLATSRWKVLFASKDYDTINKIVSLVNSTNKTGFNEKDYGSGKVIGYPIGIEIQLKSDVIWRITPLYKVASQKLKDGGMESTATPYNDRVVLDVKNGNKDLYYTLLSEDLANYILKGADKDMPFVTAFSYSPNTIKPGETVTISGDGSTEKYIEVYIINGNSASNEQYLIAKVPTNFGSWKWEGTINGRTIKTVEGKEVNLLKDRYFFEVGEGSARYGGTTIDLTGLQ